MKKRISLCLTFIMIFSLFSGCKPVLPIEVNPVTPPENKPQYLNTYLLAEPSTLDVSLAYDPECMEILQSTTESLTRMVVVDGTTKIEPAGAASWSVSETGTVWTFVLNANKWLDGSPVTAHDYVYSLQRTATPDVGAPSAYLLYNIKDFADANTAKKAASEIGVRAVDEMTLEITLTKPTPHFLALTYLPIMAPLHKGKIEALPAAYGSDAANLETNGAFKVESWEHGKQIVLKKNSNYRDADTITLETATYKILTDENERYNLFEKGELDILKTSNREWIKRLSSKDGVTASTYAMPSVSFQFFNTKDMLFNNINIRRAFMLGINRDELNTQAFDSGRMPAYGWVSPSLCVGDQSFRGAAGDPVKTLAVENPDAKALLLKGMEELGLGTDPSTLDITFSLAGEDEWYKKLGEYFTSAYKATLGINLKITHAPWDQFITNVEASGYQIGFMAWNAAFNDPIDILTVFRTQQDAVHTGWASAEYDKLINRAQEEMDNQKRLELLISAEKLLIDNAVVSPLAYIVENRFANSFVEGIPTQSMATSGLVKCNTSKRK